ncbi:alkaline phosphatase family protein [Streptomyces globisporus]|uniref:Alkaline phosphatase family protein n=1 Tax=Streptomyces globisporus TaxID=1908 RepID=A0A927BP65_STRGL|nr:alkaline phosphatase family protein [Streptomyces globisporus]
MSSGTRRARRPRTSSTSTAAGTAPPSPASPRTDRSASPSSRTSGCGWTPPPPPTAYATASSSAASCSATRTAGRWRWASWTGWRTPRRGNRTYGTRSRGRARHEYRHPSALAGDRPGRRTVLAAPEARRRGRHAAHGRAPPARRAAPAAGPRPRDQLHLLASFLTGADPGRHGIYGFIDTEPGDYRTRFPNVNDLAATPVWQATAAAGLPALVLNVPGTYPAPPVHGALVSGFVAPDFDRAVSRPGCAKPCARRATTSTSRWATRRTTPTASSTGRWTRSGPAAARTCGCWRRSPGRSPSACSPRPTASTTSSGATSPTRPPPARPDHGLLPRGRRGGRRPGAFAGDDGALTLVSDHGFGPADTQFYLNAWLRQAGYLALPADAESLTDIDERTTAFALDPGASTSTTGTASPAARPRAGHRRGDRAGAARPAPGRGRHGRRGRPGTALVAEVLYGPELYSGPVADRAPDLVAMPAPGVQIRGAWSSDAPVLPGPFTGTHTPRRRHLLEPRRHRLRRCRHARRDADRARGSGHRRPASMEGRDMRGVDTSAPVGAGTERSAG